MLKKKNLNYNYIDPKYYMAYDWEWIINDEWYCVYKYMKDGY
jgi:hypothetical protein